MSVLIVTGGAIAAALATVAAANIAKAVVNFIVVLAVCVGVFGSWDNKKLGKPQDKCGYFWKSRRGY